MDKTIKNTYDPPRISEEARIDMEQALLGKSDPLVTDGEDILWDTDVMGEDLVWDYWEE